MSNDSQATAEIKFEADCTIYEVSGLHEKLSKAFSQASLIKLSFTDIENIDASFIQLLMAAKLEAKRKQIALEFSGDMKEISELARSINCDLLIDDVYAGRE